MRKTFWGYSEYARFRTSLTTFCGYESIVTKEVGYRCTKIEAQIWHIRDVAHAMETLRTYMHRPIEQHVYDALILLCIDIGERELTRSRVFMAISAGETDLAIRIWPSMSYGHPSWQRASLLRRAMEAMLAKTGRIGAAFAG